MPPSIHTSSSASRHSHSSQDSQSTAPTSFSDFLGLLAQHTPTDRPVSSNPVYEKPCYDISPRSSTETYASTIPSLENLGVEPESYDPEYEVPDYTAIVEASETSMRPSSPSEFSTFFPSTKRLHIRHDDTTYDGNMNLRVETEEGSGRRRTNVQLFHLRMHDLKKRQFSLRRYERSSGREVCHSVRKYAKPASERPGITRSMSNFGEKALATIRGKPDFKRTSSHIARGIQRQDSGYGSDGDDDIYPPPGIPEQDSSSSRLPTNTIKLEFSNYAQVDITRRGAKSSKRYEFDYWGHSYHWKRVTEKDGKGEAVSYHLIRGDGGHAVAHIVPELRSPNQVEAEEAAGGWVPPCSLWISDESILEALTDVADIVVATGLIALVDDSIKRHFRSDPKYHRQVGLPLTPLKMDVEFVRPRAIMQEIFKRRNSGGSTKDKEQKQSRPGFTAPVVAY